MSKMNNIQEYIRRAWYARHIIRTFFAVFSIKKNWCNWECAAIYQNKCHTFSGINNSVCLHGVFVVNQTFNSHTFTVCFLQPHSPFLFSSQEMQTNKIYIKYSLKYQFVLIWLVTRRRCCYCCHIKIDYVPEYT